MLFFIPWTIYNKATKKEILFYRPTRRTCQVGSVGQVIFYFLILFFYLWFQKNYPQNTKISRKLWYLLQKKIGKIFRLIFKKFQPKFSDLGQKRLILQDFGKNEKKKKILPKSKVKLGRSGLLGRKTGFSFFVA